MLLHELPTKEIARQLRIIVTRTDIPVIPATIALHGLMKARARQTQWFPPQGYSAAQNQSSDRHPFGLLKTSADNRSCPSTLKQGYFDHDTAAA
jgi:hypothetical protein